MKDKIAIVEQLSKRFDVINIVDGKELRILGGRGFKDVETAQLFFESITLTERKLDVIYLRED